MSNEKSLIEKVCEELLGRGYNASIETVFKNNLKVNGLVIHFEGRNLTPILYEECIEKYKDKSMDDICRGVIAFCDDFAENGEAYMKDVTNMDYILKNTFASVCRYDWNTEMLKNVPYKEIPGTDLVYYPRVRVADGTCVVSTSHAESIGISAEEILKAAVANSKEESKIVWFKDFGHQTAILTNTNGYYGASAIIFFDYLQEVMVNMETDRLAVIPSSVHEVILVPYEMFATNKHDEINNMICEVNSLLVEENERLSDHVYIFDGERFVE